MKPARHAQLQEALTKLAKEIRVDVPDDEIAEATFDDWADSMFEQLIDSSGVMDLLGRELFELVTGKEVEDPE